MSRYRSDIDGLRAFAVLSVLAFHGFPNHFGGGFLGVDVFFVISGFLISELILRQSESGRFSFKEFYSRRIRRLFPALVLVLLAVWAVGFTVLFENEYQSLAKHLVSSAFFSTNFLLWSETGYFDSVSISKPLLHIWSLSVEEQFYLFWPVLLLLVRKRLRIGTVLVGGLAFVSYRLQSGHSFPSSPVSFYSPLCRAWELLIGYFVALWVMRYEFRGRLWIRNVASGLGLFLCVFYVCRHSTSSLSVSSTDLLVVITSTAVFLAAGPEAWANRILSKRAWVAVGKASYPIYLWHYPLLAFAFLFRGEEAPAGTRLALLVVACLLGWATSRWIETPFRAGRFKTGAGTVVLASGAVLLGLLGALEGFGPVATRLPRPLDAFWKMSKISPQTQYRRKECYLDRNLGETQPFPSTCFEADASKPITILLLGDSHAGELASSLRDLEKQFGFNLIQMTGTVAQDVFRAPGAQPPGISAIPQLVEALHRFRPDVVLVSVFWEVRSFRPTTKLKSAIDLVLENGAKRVVILGPTPYWNPDPRGLLRRILIREPKRISSKSSVFDREHLRDDFKNAEKDLKSEIAEIGDSRVLYFSSSEALCREGDGCLLLSDAPLWANDNHLTVEGSNLLLKKLFAEPKFQALLSLAPRAAL